MATPEDSEQAAGKVGFKEHVDNPIVFVILVALAVTAIQAVGRYAANAAHMPGAAGAFGG